MKKPLILALSLISTSLQAQTYTQVLWGYNASLSSPVQYKVGSTWYPLPAFTNPNIWTALQSVQQNATCKVTDGYYDPQGSLGWIPTCSGTWIGYYPNQTPVLSVAGIGAVAGTVNTSGTTVTFVTGSGYGGSVSSFPAGAPSIRIGSTNYTIANYNSPTSLTLTTSAGVQTGAYYNIVDIAHAPYAQNFTQSISKSATLPENAISFNFLVNKGGDPYVTGDNNQKVGLYGLINAQPDPAAGTHPGKTWGQNIDLVISTGSGNVLGVNDEKDYSNNQADSYVGGPSFRVMEWHNYLSSYPIIASLYLTSEANNVFTGTVNTSGTAVTAVTQAGFGAFTSDISTITINGVLYRVASVIDGTHLTLVTSAGSQTGVAYSANNHAVHNGILIGGDNTVKDNDIASSSSAYNMISATGNHNIVFNAAGDNAPYSFLSKSGQALCLNSFDGCWTYVGSNITRFTQNSGYVLDLSGGASAVNRVLIASSGTGFGPAIKAVGTDTNVPLNIYAQGTSSIQLQSSLTANYAAIFNGITANSTSSSSNVFQVASNNTPAFSIYNSGGTSGQRNFVFAPTSNSLLLQAYTDAGAFSTNLLGINAATGLITGYNSLAINSGITTGTTGGSTGSVSFVGTTSGTVTIKPQNSADTYNFNLPTTAGTSGQPLLSGGGGSTAMSWGSLSGSTTTFGTTSGTLTNGHCVSIDANGNLVDAGGACTTGGGGGTVSSGTIGQLAYYAATGTTVSGSYSPTIGVAGTSAGSLAFANATSGSITLQPTTGALGTSVLTLPATTGTVTVLGNTTTGSGSIVLATSPSIASPTFTGTVAGTGTIPLTVLATQAANTVVGNATSGAASPTALSMTSCSTAGSAVSWTTNTGFGCNTSITATAVPATGVTAGALGSTVTINNSNWSGTQLSLTNGGTNASLTASNGGIIYSTASALAVLSGTATANQHLASGASGAPAWTTATFPATTTAGTILTSGTANAVTASATPTLGVNATTTGTLGLANGGATGATVTLQNNGATTAYNFNLPTTVGTAGYLLTSQAGGTSAMTWTSPTTTVNGQSCTLGSTCTVTAVASSIAFPATVSGTVTSGGIPYFSSATGMSSSAALAANALVIGGGAGVAPATTTTGTGVVTAIGNNTNTNGGFVVPTTALAQYSLVVGGGSGTGPSVIATGSAGQHLQSGGAAANPSWTTATFPATTTAGTLLASGTANTVTASATPTLGVAGTTAGTLTLSGVTSGTATIQTAAAAGTGTIFQVPSTNGTTGYALTTNGSGVTSWNILGVAGGGTGLATGTSGGIPYFSSATGMSSSAALAANALVIGGGAGVAPATTTTGTGVVTAIGNNTNTAGGLVVPTAALGSGQIVLGGGSGASPTTSANASIATGALTLGAAGTQGSVIMGGSTSGTLQIKPAAAAGTGSVLTFPGGTTDFSATGGTSQVVKQTTAGGAFTVAQLANTDITGLGTASTVNTGTSGATIPLLSTANTWTTTQTFNGIVANSTGSASNQFLVASNNTPALSMYNSAGTSGQRNFVFSLSANTLLLQAYTDAGAFSANLMNWNASNGLTTNQFGLNVVGGYQNNGVIMVSPTAPTATSVGGCGTSPSVTANGTAAFQVTIGSSPTAAACSITMPTATTGWACSVSDITTQSTSIFLQKQIASTTTSIQVANYSTAGTLTAFTASDKLNLNCHAF